MVFKMLEYLLIFILFSLIFDRIEGASVKLWSNVDWDKCGVEVSSNLIHHNPWLADLQYWRGDDLTGLRCAATLIDKRHLLTAAHCIKKIKFSHLKVRLGEYDLNSEKDCVQGVCADPVVTIDVEETFVHPHYDGRENDIAILRLAADAPFTDFIRPICLPSGSLEKDTTFIAAGWGVIPKEGVYSHVKKIIPLPKWDENECRTSYKHTVLAHNIICAGGEEGIDTCRGDSGGPLTRVGKTIELWGITSGGSVPCGRQNIPGIYTDVQTYIKWIEKILL